MECLLPGEEVGPAVARLTLGSRPTDPELTEATPAGRQASFRMADVTFADDKEVRNVPQLIVYIHTSDRPIIDGASELQIFWQVIIPQIRGTIITVFITVLILVMKVFDIVYVLTNGRNNTDVIANMFFNELFARNEAGRATALVVVLLVAVIPILIFQVRQFREQEAMR